MEIKDKNRKQISLLYEEKLYTLESLVSVYEAEKWYNSIKLIKDMGDLQNLDTNRYVKLNVYTKENGRIVFKDYDLLLEAYETKICNKIIIYKWDKIFWLAQQTVDQMNKSKKDVKKRAKTEQIQQEI